VVTVIDIASRRVVGYALAITCAPGCSLPRWRALAAPGNGYGS